MSRSGYSDDCDGWELIRWRGAVAAAIRGTRGQELLHGLASALDAMPEKRLIAYEMVMDGEVCALGALARATGRIAEVQRLDAWDREAVAKFFNIAEALAAEIAYINDADSFFLTPRVRWMRVREWVEDQLLVVGES